MGFQVVKWCLKVRMVRCLKVRMSPAQSNVEIGREFQVDGAATEKARRASSVCI